MAWKGTSTMAGPATTISSESVAFLLARMTSVRERGEGQVKYNEDERDDVHCCPYIPSGTATEPSAPTSTAV